MTHHLEGAPRTKITWDQERRVFHAESNDGQIKPVLRRLAERFGVPLSEDGDMLRGTFPRASDLNKWDPEAQGRIEFVVIFTNKAEETLPAVIAAPIRVGPVRAMPATIKEPSGPQVVSEVILVQPRRSD